MLAINLTTATQCSTAISNYQIGSPKQFQNYYQKQTEDVIIERVAASLAHLWRPAKVRSTNVLNNNNNNLVLLLNHISHKLF